MYSTEARAQSHYPTGSRIQWHRGMDQKSNAIIDRSVLHEIAGRLFLWQSPEEVLQNPIRFLSRVMTIGTRSGVLTVRKNWSMIYSRRLSKRPHPVASTFVPGTTGNTCLT